MYIARRGVQAVVLLSAASLCAVPALSQSTRFLRAEARSLHVPTLYALANPCSSNSNHSPYAAWGDNSRTDDSRDSLFPCDRPEPPIRAAVESCAPSLHTAAGCPPARDYVRDDLNAMGKQGKSILHARDKVLEILQTENGCSAWYRTKDPDAAATFRTLTFALDRDGDVYVRSIPETGGIQLIRNPYVASVIQGGGPSSTVTLNINGAFFFSMGTVVDDRFEGGPVSFRGARPIQVGPYSGGSFRAQVLALLHEFGHVIDLLPMDRDDYEGRSRQNTADVLRICRAQVESKEAPRTILASR
jgi:hypothetical protein